MSGHPNPTQDPEFYCHGQRCIDGSCSPLYCRDQDDIETAVQEEI